MILRERCNIWESVQGRFDLEDELQASDVPCTMEPISSSEKEYRGTAVEQTYLFITRDQTIPFVAGAEFSLVWRGKVWNVKGNLADVAVRGRLHHREAIIAYVRTAQPDGTP